MSLILLDYLRFSDKNFVHISHLSHACHMTHAPPNSSILIMLGEAYKYKL